METRRILIVEDESIVRLHLSKVVESMGHTVSGLAASAEEAIASAARSRPDLAIMDIHLQGEPDGIETAKQLRDRFGVAVMFATAFADAETVARTRSAGALGYIVKPFDQRAVQAVITTALAESDRLHAIQERERSLATILGNLGEAVFAVDRDFRINFLNPRARDLVGSLAENCLGKLIWEVLRPCSDDLPALNRSLELALTDQPDRSLPTMAIVRGDGTERLVNGSVEPAFNAVGVTEGLVISIRDMTDRWLRAARNTDRDVSAETTRMLIYSHDTFGLGHLRRCLNLATALVETNPGLSILLVTGSTVAHRYQLPPRVDYVKLPAVQKVSPQDYAARAVAMSDDGVRNIRSNLLLRTARDFNPDLVLVDHSPVGMRGEMRPTLEWLHDNRPECVKLLGLRDIIDEPATVIESWKKQNIYPLLSSVYDHVLIYGARSFFDPITAYQFPADLASRSRFLDYVVEEPPDGPVPGYADTQGRRRPLVVVTTGGGDGAVELIVGTMLDMLAEHADQVNFDTVILPGPLAPAEVLAELRQRATGPHLSCEEFVPSTSPYMQAADLVICTGGYNTTVQLLRYGRRALMIPRVMHRAEQLLRAKRLQELGLVEFLHPADVSSARLWEMIRNLLATDAEPLTVARSANRISFDGARGLAAFCAELIASRQHPREATL